MSRSEWKRRQERSKLNGTRQERSDVVNGCHFPGAELFFSTGYLGTVPLYLPTMSIDGADDSQITAELQAHENCIEGARGACCQGQGGGSTDPCRGPDWLTGPNGQGLIALAWGVGVCHAR